MMRTVRFTFVGKTCLATGRTPVWTSGAAMLKSGGRIWPAKVARDAMTRVFFG